MKLQLTNSQAEISDQRNHIETYVQLINKLEITNADLLDQIVASKRASPCQLDPFNDSIRFETEQELAKCREEIIELKKNVQKRDEIIRKLTPCSKNTTDKKSDPILVDSFRISR